MARTTKPNAPVNQTEAFEGANGPTKAGQPCVDTAAAPIVPADSGQCPDCDGIYGTPCQHGDATDRAIRALAFVEIEQEAARVRQRGGQGGVLLPENVQEALGEAYERAAKRTDANSTYVRRLAKIREKSPKLFAEVEARRRTLAEAWMEVRDIADPDDPDTWLTPEKIVEPIRRKCGGRIDLDPATLILPDGKNPTDAREAYAWNRGDDGLVLPWHVDRSGRRVTSVILNSPYGNPGRDKVLVNWTIRAVEQARQHELAIWQVLPGAWETGYGQIALANATGVFAPKGRIGFTRSDGSSPGQPTWGTVIVTYGTADVGAFAAMDGTIRYLREVAA
jgi:hypothetical protein